MACSSGVVAFSALDDIDEGRSSGSQLPAGDQQTRRRRHSHHIPRRKSIVNQIMDGEEALLLRVDLFLSELERRLDFLESYGDLTIIDSSISRAYSTLHAVRTRCSQASEDVIGAGRRRLQVMVETLDTRYHEALAATESLNEKARVGIELLDNMLSEFESHAYKLRKRSLANAADTATIFMDEGRRVVDESIERAREVVDESIERAREVVDEGLERAKRAAVSLEEHIQVAVAVARERGLLRYEELPVPWRVNPHILKGYRFSESKVGCVRSMFGISNELVNIWSHGLGFFLVLSVAFYFYPTSVTFSLSTKTDVFIAAVFFFAACQCLVCSTIWHTMNAVADVNLVSHFACVDFVGIALLVSASIITTEYTAFYCDPWSRWAYLTVTAVLGITGVILPWHPRFNGQDMAWARVGFYAGLGATGFMPIPQLCLTRGVAFTYEFYSPIAKSLLVYLVGAFIYASKVPERWCPGMFDYIGGSHNLWHMAVLGGIFFHYNAMHQFFSTAFKQAQDGCPVY